jgi:23S rRNA pseudouridine1911/1915/1917 synthase
MAERLTFTVPEDLDGERLDRVVAVLGKMSRSVARALVDAGSVTVDRSATGPKTRLVSGQTVAFDRPVPDEGLLPEPVDFAVVYEDDDVLVVDKPPGVVVHPGAGHATGTLAAGILHRHPGVAGVGQQDRWGLVHRLDRDTSGLLVVALTEAAYAGLADQIRARQVDRTYIALVDGTFGVPTGTIDAPIDRDPARPTRRRVSPDGRPARTHYEVVDAYPNQDVTLLRVRLETGRTHQIRVHLSAIDHPLVGDSLYRSGPDRVPTPRLFLHAHRLAFDHPISGRRIEVESPLPADLAGVLADL